MFFLHPQIFHRHPSHIFTLCLLSMALRFFRSRRSFSWFT
ncbi:hypothetical protein AKJ16_DCAP11929 [Drosera capensis]